MIVQSKQVLRRLISSIGYDVRCIKHEPSPMLLADNQIPFGFRHLLADYLHRKGSDDFFFIQVGAFDGIQCDPLYDYVQRHKWSGVLLEPQRKAFEQLTENYKSQPQLRLMNAAIAEKPGSCTLYTLAGEGLPPWCEGMASFDRDVLLKHQYLISDLPSRIREEQVECVTFESMLPSDSSQEVDLLQVDTEGHDAQIIAMFPLERVKPSIIHFESKHIPKAELETCLERLADHRYVFARDGGEDMIACLASILK